MQIINISFGKTSTDNSPHRFAADSLSVVNLSSLIYNSVAFMGQSPDTEIGHRGVQLPKYDNHK